LEKIPTIFGAIMSVQALDKVISSIV